MLTARGWWFFASAVVVAAAGVAGLGAFSATVPILGISLVVWFLWEWAVFAGRFRAAGFAIDRELVQGGRVVPAAWAGHAVTVRVSVTLTGVRLPFVVLEDRRPADSSPGSSVVHGCELVPGEPAEFEYVLADPRPGVIRFEGVTVRVADLAGFFYRRVFVRAAVEYLVLPPLADDEGKQRADKRFNTLPPPGAHRLRRPGSGSELLDLRDYRPGDPPKMIAWKASARRDRLVTKEFESDVPVRCVLFLDASEGARVGPPGHAPVVRLAGVAAGVAQAAAGARDLVGLTVFDDDWADAIAPARTQAHVIRVLQAVAEAAGRLPPGGPADPLTAARFAFPVARELYPDLLAADVNSRPFGLFWRPIADSRWFGLVLGLFVLTSVLVSRLRWLKFAINSSAGLLPASAWWGWKVAAFLVVFVPLLVLPTTVAVVIWFVHGVRGFLDPARTRTARRKQLAAVYSVVDHAGPAEIERLLHDDAAFVERTGRFLRDHRVRVPVELFDAAGNYRFRSAGKLRVLADAIVRAVGRARDNELYVVLADVAELGDSLEPLVAAARVARARHHQMLVLVPWPAGVPVPVEQNGRAAAKPAGEPVTTGLAAVAAAVLADQYARGYADVRTALTRAGAVVVRVGDGDPIRLVLDRLDRVRGARVRR